MKKIIPMILLMLPLASCNGWVIQRGPFNPPTPFLPPTNTPSIFTATPVVIGVASATPTPQIATATAFSFPTATATPTLSPSGTPEVTTTLTPSDDDDTPSTTPTSSPSGPALFVEILSCNTSIDVTHGMGEVTNAYVLLRNTGGVELTNLKVTLNALDEEGPHPDKTAEVASLAVGYQISLKLTVDTTFQKESPIQVEVSGDPGLFERVGAETCKGSVLLPEPKNLKTPVPNTP